MQGRMAMEGGVGRATEVEEDIDPATGRDFLEHPDKLLALESPILEKVR